MNKYVKIGLSIAVIGVTGTVAWYFIKKYREKKTNSPIGSTEEALLDKINQLKEFSPSTKEGKAVLDISNKIKAGQPLTSKEKTFVTEQANRAVLGRGDVKLSASTRVGAIKRD